MSLKPQSSNAKTTKKIRESIKKLTKWECEKQICLMRRRDSMKRRMRIRL